MLSGQVVHVAWNLSNKLFAKMEFAIDTYKAYWHILI